MDEPCSALDPIATAQIEELIDELKQRSPVVIVTHSMQQAARISQKTAFFHLGNLVEYGDTDTIFTNPQDDAHGKLHHRSDRVRLFKMASQHMVSSFDDDLKSIEAQIMEMGVRIEKASQTALQALET